MIYLQILIIIILLILDLLVLGMAIVLRRRNKIKKIKTNLGYFSPAKLSRRMESYVGSVKINNEIAEINEKSQELIIRDYKKIQKMLKKIELLAMPVNVLKVISFNLQLKQLIKNIKIYEREYLDIRFTLFDLTSDIEIEKAILSQLKQRSSKATEAISNSPIERIRDSKKLGNKVNRLRANLKKLEDMIDEQVKHLSDEFIQFVKKIDNDIQTIARDVDFMNFHIKHLEEDLKAPLIQIVESYKKNKDVLAEIAPIVKEMSKDINLLKEDIKIDTDDLKVKRASENTIKLDQLISDLNLLIHSNIDYARFNQQYDKVSDALLTFVKENHGLFTSEIKRHKLPDERNRLLMIESSLEAFEASINKYEREKISRLNKHSPHGVHNLLLGIVHEYKNYNKVVSQNVADISKVNSSTNDINKEIALMNTLLLQVEYNINSLHGLLRDNYELEKEELQNKVSLLRENFKNNTKEIDKKSFEIANKIKNKIEDLVSRTKGSEFEIFFLKESILFLNRYKGMNREYDEMLDSINESYEEERFNEALRKTKEIIEIYGIK